MYIVHILNGFLSLALWIPFGIGGWVLGLASPHVPVAIREPGIVYSVKQAESLGLDAQQTYADILDTLHPRYVRLIAYWDRIEKQQGIYDFSEMDAFVAASEQHYVKLMLVVGQKVPRWPECHIPYWAMNVSQSNRENAALLYIQAFVDRYKDSTAVEFWQVENEPFFGFGVCPKDDAKFFNQEIQMVRSRDPRPIIVTASGEMDPWIQAFRVADAVGVSLYRRAAWQLGPAHITLDYPLPPLFYYLKAKAMSAIFHKPVMVVELQLEPWLVTDLSKASLDTQFASMSFDNFVSNLSYADHTRIPRVYMWGVEWWEWLRARQHPEFFDYVRHKYFFVQ